MKGFTETHRSFVNTWECDENDHLNVQFYMKRFDEAARFFAVIGDTPDAASPALRHVRYHSELRAGDMTATRSALLPTGRIVHLIDNMGSGRLAATAVDTPAGHTAGDGDLLGDFPPEARPRTLDDGAEPLVGKAAILAAGGVVTHRRAIHPGDCDTAGRMLPQHLIGIASDGAPHVWHHAGYGSGWLIENGFGRVAVEMKATFSTPARAGDLVEMVSAPAALGARTMRLTHELARFPDGASLARVDVVALIIDLATRRAIGADKFAELRERAGG